MIIGVRRLASLRLTLGGLAWLGGALVVDQLQLLPAAWSITPPLALLAINLAAALLTEPRFRRQPALFGFHLCLLLLAGLAAFGQLTQYQARLVLVDGQEFVPALLETQRTGPLAPPPLPAGVLRQGEVAVAYAPGQYRGETRSQVWVAGRGWAVIGDDVPLRLEGYRFYTTSNKGFAALLSWLPEHGEPQLGAVQFPSYPASELAQTSRWQTPAGQQLQLALVLPPSQYDAHWSLSSASAQDAGLRLTVGEQQHLLQPGDVVTLDGARLRYEGVRMWMGYAVRYDPTLTWLFSLAALGVMLLGLHFGLKVLRGAAAGSVGALERTA